MYQQQKVYIPVSDGGVTHPLMANTSYRAQKLAKLVDKKKELESKEILELLKTTARSFDEIKAFLKGEEPDEDNE